MFNLAPEKSDCFAVEIVATPGALGQTNGAPGRFRLETRRPHESERFAV
jgi:hypothetical protein